MQDRYDFIISLIQEAGEKVLEARSRHIEVSIKNGDPGDLVTNVDQEISAFLSERITARYPGEHIYSEEATEEGSAPSYWSLDPIDGTSNFARGIPHYAVVISYLEEGKPVVGAIYNPVTKELFSFEKERGAFLNGAPIRVATGNTLKDAYVLLHIGRKKEVQEWGLNLQRQFLANAKKNINLGSSALDLAFLAAGRVDAVIYGTMTTADIAVATELVRAAGGEVYSPEGKAIEFLKLPQRIIATASKGLFEEIAAL